MIHQMPRSGASAGTTGARDGHFLSLLRVSEERIRHKVFV